MDAIWTRKNGSTTTLDPDAKEIYIGYRMPDGDVEDYYNPPRPYYSVVAGGPYKSTELEDVLQALNLAGADFNSLDVFVPLAGSGEEFKGDLWYGTPQMREAFPFIGAQNYLRMVYAGDDVPGDPNRHQSWDDYQALYGDSYSRFMRVTVGIVAQFQPVYTV
jgi:hypothetical protein